MHARVIKVQSVATNLPRGLTDISQIERFVHIRYLVRFMPPTSPLTLLSLPHLPPLLPSLSSSLQDVSGNHLEALSALNALPQLLTIKADHNRLTSARLEKVTPNPSSSLLMGLLLLPPPTPTLSSSSSSPLPLQMQYLQSANFSHNRIASTDGIAHPLLETLILSSQYILEPP